MSGMEPMMIGAALGGGASALRGGNPLTGALLGGIGGGVLGTASGLAKTAALNTAANPASYVSPTSFMGVAQQIPSALGSFAGANPVLSSMAFQAAQQAMEPQPLQFAPSGGLMGGQMANPQVSALPTQPFMPQRVSLI